MHLVQMKCRYHDNAREEFTIRNPTTTAMTCCPDASRTMPRHHMGAGSCSATSSAPLYTRLSMASPLTWPKQEAAPAFIFSGRRPLPRAPNSLACHRCSWPLHCLATTPNVAAGAAVWSREGRGGHAGSRRSRDQAAVRRPIQLHNVEGRDCVRQDNETGWPSS
jgi:hypothetical protein